MNWTTIAWSMGASACLTLAIVHLVIWFKQTDQLAHLLFSVTAISVAAMGYELSLDVVRAAQLVRQLRASEAASRESEARFRILADTAPVMVWMSGTDMLCNFFNKPWLEFTGRTIEQELGNGWSVGVHAEDLQCCLETYVCSFNARQPFTMEYRLRRADGEYRWVLDNGVPRYTPEGELAGYIGSCIDVTERRRAELEAARQRSELAHLSRVTLLGELSGSLAHELNQPLGAIVTNAGAALRFLARDAIIRTERDGDGTVLAVVRDFGPGLPAEAPERVFDQFYSTKKEGMGIGLSIAQSIASAHGGTLHTQNAKGGGAQFFFRLPAFKEVGV
jgi:PAS domain S-box-containing protein